MSNAARKYSSDELKSVLPQYKALSEFKEGDQPQMYKAINATTGEVFLVRHPAHWDYRDHGDNRRTVIRPEPQRRGHISELGMTISSGVGSGNYGL